MATPNVSVTLVLERDHKHLSSYFMIPIQFMMREFPLHDMQSRTKTFLVFVPGSEMSVDVGVHWCTELCAVFLTGTHGSQLVISKLMLNCN